MVEATAMDVEPTPAAAAVVPGASIVTDLHAAFVLIERFVSSREPRLMAAALRFVLPLRKAGKESPSKMVAALSAAASVYAPVTPLKQPLADVLAALPQPTADEVAAASMPPEDEAEKKAKEEAAAAAKEGDKEKSEKEAKAVEKKPPAKLPESEMLIALMALLLQIDLGQTTAAMPWALQLMERVAALKRRTLDPIAEKVYFYASWAFECGGQLASLRSPLLAAHRTAMLHHNATCQATLLNMLLRNYLHFKLFDQAEKLLTKTTFPEQADNRQLARYLYYTGCAHTRTTTCTHRLYQYIPCRPPLPPPRPTPLLAPLPYPPHPRHPPRLPLQPHQGGPARVHRGASVYAAGSA